MKRSRWLSGRVAGWTALAAATVVASVGVTRAAGATTNEPAGPAKVELRKTAGRYEIYVNQRPFYIKGAGVEFGSLEKLKEHGGNSFRTWRTDNGRERCQDLLDRAYKNGLYVTMGLDLRPERRGFDYDDPKAVARQFESIKAQVLRYKDHPALIIWAIGNELNLNYTNPKVWNAINDISRMIHQVDTNHLTTTTLAGFSKPLAEAVRSGAPDLDFLSFQMYSEIIKLPRYLEEAHWDQPYLITEWGATGHWECPKTAWNAPIEDDSSTKANQYQMRFEKVINSDQRLCLGSYVFFWGQKQERTPTWYGMFLRSGEETAAVDAMHRLWLGNWPANRSPQLDGIWLDHKTPYQNVRLKAGQTYQANVKIGEGNGEPLRYAWEIMEESKEQKVGGDVESVPRRLAGLIADPEKSEISMKAPAAAGAYRLFGYVYDGKGHAAYANIPFYVEGPDAALKTARNGD